MQSNATTVELYLQEQPTDRRAVLAILRKLIRDTLPTAVEAMRYGMAVYDMGDLLCGLAAQKNNYALYMGDTALVAKYKPKLGKVSVSKGCVRFKKIEDLSLDTVEHMLREAGQRRADGITEEACDDTPA